MAHAVCRIISHLILFLNLLKVMSFFKVSYAIGISDLSFSATHALMPLTGAFGGLVTTVGVIAFNLCSRLFVGVSHAPYLITYHIPSVMASAYWIRAHWLIHVVVPLICMIFFIAHPVGMSAVPYACYWFIPIIIYYGSLRSVFARSLGSTMVAHAVGSVIWIYTVPMTSAHWYALLPLVAVERLIYAIAMTLSYHALEKLYAFLRQQKWIIQPTKQ